MRGAFLPEGTAHPGEGRLLNAADRRTARDMQDAALLFVQNLRKAKGPGSRHTRHTGPSTLFRYFFQAGYEWLGAEQM